MHAPLTASNDDYVLLNQAPQTIFVPVVTRRPKQMAHHHIKPAHAPHNNSPEES